MSTRPVIFTHVAAVCVCAVIAHFDGSLPAETSVAAIALGVLTWMSLFAWFACPAFVLYQVFKRGLSWSLARACVVEALLVVAQYIALLPMVQ